MNKKLKILKIKLRIKKSLKQCLTSTHTERKCKSRRKYARKRRNLKEPKTEEMVPPLITP